MRTSNQLTNIEQCAKHPHANITQTTDSQMRASAQKSVIMRILKGESITDIKGEIDSILISRNCLWENREQRAANLALYNARINRFIAYEQSRPHIFADSYSEEDLTVSFFGENVLVKPDFFVLDEEHNEVHIVKIKTGRFKNEIEDIQSYEAYVYGLLGEKLFPGKTVKIEIEYLGDSDAKLEMRAINNPYQDNKKVSRLVFDNSVKAYFEAKHEQEAEKETDCTPEQCESCSMHNVCFFEEAPISINIMKEVKPISEIRLTYDQKRVIDYEEGVARINAGAGAGKTLVVAMRIVELLKKGYEPEDICLLTFTKAGAEEMTARVVQYCAGNGFLVDPARLTSTTFNAFCQNLITEHFDELGYTAPPRVIPDETRSGIINRILDQFPHLPEWNYASISGGKLSRFTKNALNTAKYLFAEIKKEGYTRENNPYENQYGEVSLDLLFQMYEEYDATLHRRNLIEYDDQILLIFQLLEVHPTLFDEIGYKHIIVDEFQDTDLPQIRLLNKINDTASFKSFMAVGDDSQSIFAFRHTSPEYMINFGDYFGFFDDFNLVENHRSAGDIIQFANKVNALNENRVEKDLIATKPEGTGPVINGFYSQKDEYNWVANEIKKQIEEGKNPSDIAFLASDRKELTQMASVLTKMGIPSILMNPIPFASNSRVAALCTFYDSFAEGSTRGYIDYQNAISHGGLRGATSEELEEISQSFANEVHSGERTLGRFVEYARALDVDEVDECYQSFLEKVSYCQSMDELAEFFRDFKLYGAESMFKREGKYEGVCLTTVHSAKGLEWDITYLTLSHFDKEENHRNHQRFVSSGEKDETNRKWFVGVTRAREKLIMTGEYVLKFTQRKCILNDYVRKAYDILEKPYEYSSGAYWETKEQEKREALERAVGTLPMFSLKQKLEPDMMPTQEKKAAPGHDVMALYRGEFKKSGKKNAPVSLKEAEKIEDLSAEEIEFV